MSKEPLQFDRADYGEKKGEAVACALCGQSVWSTYYQVNGQLACERCKTDVELERNQGSGVGRFLRATLYGTGAGAVGAAIWYGVRAATDYEVGIIAIAVGFMVGAAVRKGSNGRGGWLYQSLAMFLTYGAIVGTYVPFIIQGLKQQVATSEKLTAVPAGSPDSGSAPLPEAAESPAAESPVAQPAPPAAAGAEEGVSAGRGLLALVVVAVLIAALAFAAPFLMGFQNMIGILIIGIGVYEAWKLNRRVPLEIAGPFRVGETPAPPPAPSV